MYLDLLLKSLYEKFNSDRPGLHVSDLTLCPRKSVWRKLEPELCTTRELNFYSSGRAIHDAIQTLANHDKIKESHVQRFAIEREVEFEGIVGHIDLVDTANNIPIECKSARVKTMDSPKSHYVEQLKAYMSILGSKTGVILVQLLMHFDDKPFVEFEVTMDDQEMAETKQKLLLDKDLYIEALEKKDPMIARGVTKNENMLWLCKGCPHYADCLKNDIKEEKKWK